MLSMLPEHAMRILRLYKNMFQRMCYNFPLEGDILRAFLRCLVEAACLASPTDLNEQFNALTPAFGRSFRELFAESGFLEGGIAVLCHQLLEYPLPNNLLPPPPQQLKPTADGGSENGVVKVESDKQKSWWDVLEIILSTRETESRFTLKAPVASSDFGYWNRQPPKSWSENKFEYAIVAADVLSLVLSLLKKLEQTVALDGTVLARGLYQYILASQVSEALNGFILNLWGAEHIFLTIAFC
jgi:hypothetical protein